MKMPLALSAAALMAVCLIAVAACSPPEQEKKRDIRSAQPESSHSRVRSPIDPWKTAAEWPVPPGPVGDAQRFLLNAPAYQYTSEGEDLNTHQKSHGEGRVVRNEAAWTEHSGTGSKNGYYSDGKIEFVFYNGRYGKEPGDADATLVDLLKDTSLQALLNQTEEHTPFLGIEKVGGVEAEIYALNARWENLARGMTPEWALGGGHLRVWVARDNHRPLKVEWKDNYADRQKSGVTHTSISTRTYRYDPETKVPLPTP